MKVAGVEVESVREMEVVSGRASRVVTPELFVPVTAGEVVMTVP